MKQKIIAVLITICLCAALTPDARAEQSSLENSVNLDQLVAHGMQIYLELEGNYDSVRPKDSNALSIGFLQWHGVSALNLMKRICEAVPAQAVETLGSALYNEILQTPLWSSQNGCGWKNRVLSSAEAEAVRTLISSDAGITCQNQYAREMILEEAGHGWDRGVRTEAALLYYCTVEHQYGVGGVSYFMQYVRSTMGITEADTIDSLDAFHGAVLEAADTYSSIRNYLGGRKKAYNFIVNTLQLSAGPDSDPTPLTDLPAPGHWARDAILWAWCSSPQIMGGSSETCFSPDKTVTRGEAITVLWKAAGCPEPVGTALPFEDVDPDSDCCKPVLWAAENGITCGTSANTFSPENEVLQGEMLTFLWAAFGREAAEGNPERFTELTPDQFYFQPVFWAAAKGVLVGSEEGTPAPICPTEACTRAYVVTYLYRLFRPV